MKYELYKEGRILKEDEYLLKIRKDKVGFLTKLTQKGKLPVAFDGWNEGYRHTSAPDKLPIYIFKEVPRSGWKLVSWRFGQSLNWARVSHPEGFTIEIYLQQFLEIIENNIIKSGVVYGKFHWEDNKLIKD